jgi:hypothetical protein
VLSGIRPSKQDVYNTALQLYRLERLHGKKFTLQDIEHNLFQIDEELSRDKRRLRLEHAMAATGRHPKQTYRGSGRAHHGGRGRGRSGRLLRHCTPVDIAAAATETTSAIVCYKCGQPGHVAPQCPTNTGTATRPQQQRPRTAPPTRPAQPSARGHVAFAQEGDTSSSTTNDSRTALVCMAHSIMDPTIIAKAMSARHLLDYNVNPTLQRPHPVPIPTIETDHTGRWLLDTTQYVTLVIPINLGQFNDFLEEHISTHLVPTTYMGNLTPLDDDCWILAHNHPLAEQDRTFAAIVYPETESERILNEGVLPALETRFHLPTRAYTTRRLSHCNRYHNSPVTVTCWHATVCITFYPVEHDMPILICDGSGLYIVPERTIPGHWIDDSDGSSSSHASTMDLEEAFAAITGTASALAVRRKDPATAEIGESYDLANFLPDSGATQHMTHCQADLFDVVERQNLGVKVADGHVTKCSTTGKIQLQMTDDNGNPLNAVLHDVMYIPGLSRRLFSITWFAKHRHYATIRNGSTTLYFGPQHSPVTLTSEGRQPMAADVTVTSITAKPHLVLCSRNHDHSANKRRTALELVHQRLGHRKCRALLAASEHGVWADTVIRMVPEQECVS